MGFGYPSADGEAEAYTALGAAPGFVHAIEAVNHVWEVLFGDADARVPDPQV